MIGRNAVSGARPPIVSEQLIVKHRAFPFAKQYRLALLKVPRVILQKSMPLDVFWTCIPPIARQELFLSLLDWSRLYCGILTRAFFAFRDSKGLGSA